MKITLNLVMRGNAQNPMPQTYSASYQRPEALAGPLVSAHTRIDPKTGGSLSRQSAYIAHGRDYKANGSLPSAVYINVEKASHTISIGPNMIFRNLDYLRLIMPQLTKIGARRFLRNCSVPLMHLKKETYYNEATLQRVLYQATKPGSIGITFSGSQPTSESKVPASIVEDAASPAATAEIALSSALDTRNIIGLLSAINRSRELDYQQHHPTPNTSYNSNNNTSSSNRGSKGINPNG